MIKKITTSGDILTVNVDAEDIVFDPHSHELEFWFEGQDGPYLKEVLSIPGSYGKEFYYDDNEGFEPNQIAEYIKECVVPAVVGRTKAEIRGKLGL